MDIIFKFIDHVVLICATSEDLDQPAHPSRPIGVFTDLMKTLARLCQDVRICRRIEMMSEATFSRDPILIIFILLFLIFTVLIHVKLSVEFYFRIMDAELPTREETRLLCRLTQDWTVHVCMLKRFT